MSRQKGLKHYYKGLIFQKQCYCYLCGKLITRCDELSLDHIKPRKLGGHSNRLNLLPTHKVCNCEKDCMTIEQYAQMKWSIAV